MNLTSSFQSWLNQHGYSSSTVRNYLVDLNKYLNFVASINQSSAITTRQIFANESLSNYIQLISTQNNAPRLLASLNKLCQFALDQNLITTNPIRKIANSTKPDPADSVASSEQLIESFKKYLVKHNKSVNTINNYINDIKQYLAYCQTQP